MAPSAALSYAPAGWASEMSAAGVGAVRGFDDRPGGAGIQLLMDAGMSVSGILAWTVSRELTLPVADLAGFRRYVITHVSKFKSVRYWEVWNEPPNGTLDHSAVSYGKVVAAAYDAAKSVDPTLQIALCAKSTHVSFLAESIEGGARGKYDFITLHPYETAGLLPQGWEGPFLGIVPSVRAMLRDKDPSRADVPVWFSEVGLESSESGRSGVDPNVQADTLLKIYAMGIAQGAAHVHWFDPRDSEGKAHGLLRGDGKPRPAYQALAALTRALGPAPRYEGAVAPNADSFGFLFRAARGDDAVLVAWSRTASERIVHFGETLEVIDPRSGTSRRAADASLQRPLLLIANGDQALAKRWRETAAKQALPSWDGVAVEHEVSLTAGRPPRGVHMIDAPKLAKSAHEIALTGRTGARFAVDPAFLSYAPHAIRITAVVRGHGRGDPGFNLRYEYAGPIEAANDHGMVVAGPWNSIRGNRPVTLTWTVEDPRFVGKYGANLAIDCDTAQHCDFSLLSLRVAKL